jgi:hypothetical protein
MWSSTRSLPIGSVEVFEQDAPGHPVDNQMVHSHEQLRAPEPDIEQDRFQQRRSSEIETGMNLAGDRLHHLGALLSVHGGQILNEERIHRLEGRNVLAPPAVDLLEPHPQRIVMRQQGVERAP